MSVIVPTYQRAALVERAVRSVLAQTYDRYEILVVDDGSTDDTEARLSALGDARLRYLRQPRNGGVARARNRGLQEAGGSLLAFLDSDDEWAPGKLAAQVALAARRPDRVGLFYTGVLEYGSGGDRIVKPAALRGDLWRELLHRNPITSASGIVIRREAMETVGMFDASFPAIEDWEYWTRIARFFEFDCVPEPLTIYHNEDEGGDDPASARRSRSFAANMTARRMFADRFLLDADREGVRHLLLLETARRHLRSPAGDQRAAMRSLARAVLCRPAEPRLYAWLVFSGLPRAAREGLAPRAARARARIPARLWFGSDASDAAKQEETPS